MILKLMICGCINELVEEKHSTRFYTISASYIIYVT